MLVKNFNPALDKKVIALVKAFQKKFRAVANRMADAPPAPDFLAFATATKVALEGEYETGVDRILTSLTAEERTELVQVWLYEALKHVGDKVLMEVADKRIAEAYPTEMLSNALASLLKAYPAVHGPDPGAKGVCGDPTCPTCGGAKGNPAHN